MATHQPPDLVVVEHHDGADVLAAGPPQVPPVHEVPGDPVAESHVVVAAAPLPLPLRRRPGPWRCLAHRRLPLRRPRGLAAAPAVGVDDGGVDGVLGSLAAAPSAGSSPRPVAALALPASASPAVPSRPVLAPPRGVFSPVGLPAPLRLRRLLLLLNGIRRVRGRISLRSYLYTLV